MTTLAVIGVGRLVKPLNMGDKIRVQLLIYQGVNPILGGSSHELQVG